MPEKASRGLHSAGSTLKRTCHAPYEPLVTPLLAVPVYLGLHRLRRTFGGGLANAQRPILEIKGLCGHRDIKSTLTRRLRIEVEVSRR